MEDGFQMEWIQTENDNSAGKVVVHLRDRHWQMVFIAEEKAQVIVSHC